MDSTIGRRDFVKIAGGATLAVWTAVEPSDLVSGEKVNLRLTNSPPAGCSSSALRTSPPVSNA